MEEYEVTFSITYTVTAKNSDEAWEKAGQLAKSQGIDTKELYVYVDGKSMN